MKKHLFTFLILALGILFLNAQSYEHAPLPYADSALEPIMDTETVKLHYGKHHAAYVAGLNAALKRTPQFKAPKSLETLLLNFSLVPQEIQREVRNFGGGHYNHTFFWKGLTTPHNPNDGPTGKLAKAITKNFNSIDAFKSDFLASAMSHFGSGWVWLILKNDGNLAIVTTPNQDNPLLPAEISGSAKGFPILTLDLWEHSFYLKYKNQKAEYIKAFWNIVNWTQAEQNYDKWLKHLKNN